MSPQQTEEAHRNEAMGRLSTEGRKHFGLIEFDANEELVIEIRKHPIGLLLILLIGGLVGLITMLIAGYLATADLNTALNTTGLNAMRGPLVATFFVLLIITVVGTLIGVFLYRGNVIYVTSEKIAQVLYTSLFHRKVSQLSIGDVQDVTVSQNGILAHIFNYGTLVVETAGEQQNYTFTFVPDPYVKSRALVGAHERNLTMYGN
jgi:uncharacterized membrane protein YdbT with pleckstrin-like domain